MCNLKKEYCTHKYFVYNDKYHWPRILASVPEYGPIYHMDYSENMAQKFEVQSAHFNKRNCSLHCTVEHVDINEHPNLKSPYIYHYHLSDDMTHDSAFTSEVFDRCIKTNEDDLPKVIRNKSDNCSIQYKCGKAFDEFSGLSKKWNRNVIKYYGPSGHGKGLVDAMSAFGVKSPLLKAVLANNFRYNSSEDICMMLQSHFEGDEQKKYSVIDTEDILLKRSQLEALPIKGSRAFHMMCFKPDGSILAKVDICSCDACLLGNFMDCVIEPGRVYHAEVGEDDEEDDYVEYENDDVFGDEIPEMMEMYELRSTTVLEIVDVGDVVALRSADNFEQFYLCKVVSCGIADKEFRDKNDHIVEKGAPYLKV